MSDCERGEETMKEIKCTACERGCTLRADSDLYEITISGNKCPRGKEYALGEYINPTREVTFNVRVRGGSSPVVSAKTAYPIAVTKILPLSRLLLKLSVDAPVAEGQPLFASLLGERIVSTSAVEKEAL